MAIGSVLAVLVVGCILVLIIKILFLFLRYKPHVCKKGKICRHHKEKLDRCSWCQQYRTYRIYYNDHQNDRSTAQYQNHSSDVEAAVKLIPSKPNCIGCREGRILQYFYNLECRLNSGIEL